MGGPGLKVARGAFVLCPPLYSQKRLLDFGGARLASTALWNALG